MIPQIKIDYIDKHQIQSLGEKEQLIDPGAMFIRDYKRDDWKKLSAQRKLEIMHEIFDMAKMKENYLAIEMLHQIILDLEERIRFLEGWRSNS